MRVIVRASAPSLAQSVRVVEANQPLAAWPVQSERVIKSVRLLWRNRHTGYHEANPIAAGRIDDKNLTVKIERVSRPGSRRVGTIDGYQIKITVSSHRRAPGVRPYPNLAVSRFVPLPCIGPRQGRGAERETSAAEFAVLRRCGLK